MAGQHSFSFRPVAAGLIGEDVRNAMKDMVGDGEFFSILLPDGSRLLHAIPRSEKHPISFGRDVLAQLIGEPTRYAKHPLHDTAHIYAFICLCATGCHQPSLAIQESPALAT